MGWNLKQTISQIERSRATVDTRSTALWSPLSLQLSTTSSFSRTFWNLWIESIISDLGSDPAVDFILRSFNGLKQPIDVSSSSSLRREDEHPRSS